MTTSRCQAPSTRAGLGGDNQLLELLVATMTRCPLSTDTVNALLMDGVEKDRMDRSSAEENCTMAARVRPDTGNPSKGIAGVGGWGGGGREAHTRTSHALRGGGGAGGSNWVLVLGVLCQCRLCPWAFRVPALACPRPATCGMEAAAPGAEGVRSWWARVCVCQRGGGVCGVARPTFQLRSKRLQSTAGGTNGYGWLGAATDAVGGGLGG